MLDRYGCLVYVLPLMASLVKKKKGNRLYYYLVESARVDGKPRIVHQAYLGTAEKLAELVQQKTTPVPLSATLRDFGLPGALWLEIGRASCRERVEIARGEGCREKKVRTGC